MYLIAVKSEVTEGSKQPANTVGSPTSERPLWPAEPITQRAFLGIILYQDSIFHTNGPFCCLTAPSLSGLTL